MAKVKAKRKAVKRSKAERSKAVAGKAPVGNMLEAIRWIAKRAKAVTIPEVAAHFGRNDSTVDNWLRSARDRGLLKQQQPGDMEGKLEHAGRPPTSFDLTAAGRKWLENPVLPRRGRKPGTKMAPKATAKPKAKSAKRKATKTKAAAKTVRKAPASPVKPKAGKGKPPGKAERDAAAKRAKRAAAKAGKVQPAPTRNDPTPPAKTETP